MMIEGVEITSVGLDNFTEQEAQNYLDYVKAQVTTPLKLIQVKMCDDGKVDVSYLAKGEKFERIRRITGYLVGTTDRWNDAKQSEEHERVKHNVLA
jgi:anaerobic ribonucleoside-triphosphate reductase